MSAIAFDATQVSPATERTAWPKGRYKVIVSASEVKPSSSGKGSVIHLTLKSMEGPTTGQSLQTTINWKNDNPDAQRIGQSELSSLCHAVNVLRPADTANFHGIPFSIDVDTREVKKTDDQGVTTTNIYNDVKAYRYADGSPVVATAGQAPAPAATATPPAWANQAATQPAQAPAPAATLVAPPAPAPAPPAPAPPAPAALPPAPVHQATYYVSHKGVLVTPQPVPLSGIQALGLPPAEFQVNEYGTPDWKPGASLFGAPAPAPAVGGTPPWMQTQPQV